MAIGIPGVGFDRFRCYDMCLKSGEQFEDLGLADVCGKCVVGLPCSHCDPVAVKRAAKH